MVDIAKDEELDTSLEKPQINAKQLEYLHFTSEDYEDILGRLGPEPSPLEKYSGKWKACKYLDI